MGGWVYLFHVECVLCLWLKFICLINGGGTMIWFDRKMGICLALTSKICGLFSFRKKLLKKKLKRVMI